MGDSRIQVSLLPHCIPCRAECCRYSSPILDKDERDRIVSASGRDYFLEISTAHGSYHIIGRKPDGSIRDLSSEPCSYLAPDGTCSIQHIKPLDCGAYPVRAVNCGQGLSWHIHRACPAVGFLPEPFLEAAKKLAVLSVSRFPPAVYWDWLKRFSSWTLEPEAVFEEADEGRISCLQWWHAFFDSEYVRFAEARAESGFSFMEDACRIADIIGVDNDRRVLELGCQWGQLSHHLAGLGFRIISQEMSRPLLLEWGRRAYGYDSTCHPLLADYRNIPLDDKTCDSIIGREYCLGMWADEKDDSLVLREAYRILKDDGKLILSLLNTDHLVLSTMGAQNINGQDCLWTLNNYFDPESRRWIQHLTSEYPDGTRRRRVSSTRLYTWPELRSLLRSAGFLSVKVFGDFDGSKLTTDSRRLAIIATK